MSANGMGVLIYRSENSITASNDVSDLQVLGREVNKILNDDYTGNIEALVTKAGSSNGARPKVLIKVDGVEWVVKFKSSYN